MAVTPEITSFQTHVWEYYHASGRHDLQWRQPDSTGQFDPYAIMVSELMLQQTQVARVIPKYHEFLQLFPSVEVLGNAELAEVLRVWSGLGYNRRAKFLWQAAGDISRSFHGQFPDTAAELVRLPGIGKNTAGAILAYAFNQPVVFIETNIRTVYIHHFFKDEAGIPDVAISELVAASLDRANPREWYWALMDYGSHLKKTVGNSNQRSKTYVKQATFHGSRRQIRGQILKQLAAQAATLERLEFLINDERLASVLDDLVAEKLIQQTVAGYQL